MKRITVNASKNYPVLIGKRLLNQTPGQISEVFGSARPQTLCIVSDDVVWELYGKTLEHPLEKAGFQICNFVFPQGETSKRLGIIEDLLEFLAENQLTRSDALIALGGGVVGDLSGFAAAVYLRGISFIQIPTTLLAAVDSSVGGKTGVNLNAGKNLIGAFWQPSFVLFDVETMQTLPHSQQLDGLAEAFKAAVIADADLLAYVMGLSDFTNPNILIHIVSRSIEIKKRIVEEDERDQGIRQLLNFGHTVGHAIEKCSNFTISHGQAVAMGMAVEAKASAAKDWCSSSTAETIIKSLQSLGFSLNCPYSAGELSIAVMQDKKRMGNQITLAIPLHLGNSQLKTIPVSHLKDFLKNGLFREELT